MKEEVIDTVVEQEVQTYAIYYPVKQNFVLTHQFGSDVIEKEIIDILEIAQEIATGAMTRSDRIAKIVPRNAGGHGKEM